MSKRDIVEGCKTDYGSALQIFNKEQDEHYTIHMPKLFQVCLPILACRNVVLQFFK